HTYQGDIRLTVRDTGGTSDVTGPESRDEDLELIDHGSARFAESDFRQSIPDAPRIIGRGQIFAEKGSITLNVGDDIETDANSRIVAAKGIDILGDANFIDGTNQGTDPDIGFGTNMKLLGEIIAGAVLLTAGTLSGPNPVGVAVRSTSAPVYLTRIFG